MKKLFIPNLLLVAGLVSACAGGTANPVLNTSVKKPHIYAPGEAGTLGLPPAFSKATGEVRFCSAGAVGEARRQEALKAVAEACGGEDKYSVISELMADATGSFMGVDVKCAGNSGRAIYFICKGAKPAPTGYKK